MNVSPVTLEKPKAWEPKFDFRSGEAVTVIKNQNPKEYIRRKGQIVWVGEIFVCIWICSLKAPKQNGWRECFFYQDIANGKVIVEKEN